MYTTTTNQTKPPKNEMLTTTDTTTTKESNGPNDRVFQLWPTGETFNRYQDYVHAMFSHKQPVWTCRFTGRTGLLYKEAYESEKKAEAQILALPEELRRQLLKRVHGSIESIEQLAQALVDMTLTGPGVGDCVKVTVEGEQMIGKIVEVITGPGPVQYRVELLGPVTNDETSHDLAGEVGATGTGVLHVLESKSLISRNLAKKLIRGCATRKHQYSPWAVDDSLCKKHQLAPLLPVSNTKSVATQVFGGKEFGAPIKALEELVLPEYLTQEYPVPDLLVPYQLIGSCQWPSPQESVHSLLTLETWNFLHEFADPLELAPFDLEDWEGALKKRPSSWIIWEETVIALLKPLFAHRRGISKTAFANLMQCLREDVPDLVTANNEQSEEPVKRPKEEHSEYSSGTEDADFTASPSETSSSEERVRVVVRNVKKKKAPIQQTRRSIRTLAKSLPDVVLRPKKQAPPPFDFRTLKWYDSVTASQLLHETQRKAKVDSSVANSLLLGMFVELEPQVEWIATFLGELRVKSGKAVESVFYELSSESLLYIVDWLVRANGQLPWLREWVNTQLETREESRRQARDYDLQRRSLKRELHDTETQIKMSQTRANLDKEDTISKDLKSAELRAKKLTSKISDIEILIKECDTRTFEGVRVEALGVDRWNRRYWHLAGRLLVEIDVERGEFGEKQQQQSTSVKEEEQLVIDVDEEMSPSIPNATSNTSAVIPISSEGETHSMSVDDQESEQTEKSSSTRWYQYTRPEHIEALKSYLCPLGIHESELLAALHDLPSTPLTTLLQSPPIKDVDMFDDEVTSNISDAASSSFHTRKRRRIPIVEIGIRKNYVNKLR